MMDPKLNMDNLQQCLVKVVKSEHTAARTKEDFEAYYVLANLGEVCTLCTLFHVLLCYRSYRHIGPCYIIAEK